VAAQRARALGGLPTLRPADGVRRTVRVAIGDPQAPLERVLASLDHHGLLGDDGRLRPEVFLVSMGDHFDFGPAAQRRTAAADGLAFLSFLADHPADQTVIILGNHDLVRVGELHGFDEATFARAQAQADLAYRGGEVDPALEARFLADWPMVSDAEALARDFSAFAPAQRALVEQLLRAGRAQLAFAASERVVLTHAGLTVHDFTQLGLPAPTTAPEIERALAGFLDGRVSAWRSGPLDLAPLHLAGTAASGVGRGILFQRPAHPSTGEPELFEGPPRRRFDPRWLLPGVTQAIGHIRDAKCRTLLGPWVQGAPAGDGPLRSLTSTGTDVTYRAGVVPGASLVFLDGGMSHSLPERYQLLDLDRLAPAEPLPR